MVSKKPCLVAKLVKSLSDFLAFQLLMSKTTRQSMAETADAPNLAPASAF